MNEFSNFNSALFPMFINLTWQFALLVGCAWLVIKVGLVRSAPIQHSLWSLCVFSPILLLALGIVMPNTNLLLQQRIGQYFTDTSIAKIPPFEKVGKGGLAPSDEEFALEGSEPIIAKGLAEEGPRSKAIASPSLIMREADYHTPPLPITTAVLANNDNSSNWLRIAFVSGLSYVPVMVVLLWIVGVVFSLLRLGWGAFGLHKLRKNARLIDSGPFRELLETLKTRMDIRRPVTLATSSHVQTPISLGVWRPVILLPNQLRTDNLEKLKLAFIHELAHIRRYDALINWCQQIFGAFCFFHPLFRLASRHLTQAREQLCDNWVIQQSDKRGEYAAFLAGSLETATSNGIARAVSLAVIPTKYSVMRRINMILEPRNTIKTKLSCKTASIVMLAGLLTILLLSATRILPMPSLLPKTEAASTHALDPFSDNTTINEVAETHPENSPHGNTKPNSGGVIENRPVLFKNRGELARSRKPGPDCYGVAIYVIYATVSGKSSEDVKPWDQAGSSVISKCERIVKEWPEVKVKILLNEHINLYPGHRFWGFNTFIADVPILGKSLRFILNDSPIQASAIKFMYQGEEKYTGLAVNNHRGGVQLALNFMRRTLNEALDRHHSTFSSNYAKLNRVSAGSSWGGGPNHRSGYYYQIKLIETSSDNIALKPGEVLDVSKPPLMSITKFKASLPPSSAPTKSVATKNISINRIALNEEATVDEETETPPRKFQDEATKSNLSDAIENRSALFKNRDELVRSRKPGKDCYGVAAYLIHVIGVPHRRSWRRGPLKKNEREIPDFSAAATIKRILEKYPQAKVKILFDEQVNLHPGARCWDFNAIGEAPVLGWFVKTILKDSPTQPAAIKFMYQGEVRYTGLAVNRHSAGIQLASNSSSRALEQAFSRDYAMSSNYAQPLRLRIDLNFQSDLDNNNISEKLRKKFKDKKLSLSQHATISIENPGNRWKINDEEQTYTVRKENGKLNIYARSLGDSAEVWGGGTYPHGYYLHRIRLIDPHLDYITLKPGEILDVSRPPLMSITKFKASLSPSSAPVKSVATLGDQKSGTIREEKVLYAFNPASFTVTLTGTVYHEDGRYKAQQVPPGKHTVRLEVYDEGEGKTETLMEKVVEVKAKEVKAVVDFVVGQ